MLSDLNCLYSRMPINVPLNAYIKILSIDSLLVPWVKKKRGYNSSPPVFHN
jgi:hypothetical protein